MPVVLDALKNVAGLAGYAISILVCSILFHATYGLMLGGASYAIAANGSFWRGIGPAVVAFTACLVVGLFLTAKLTTVFTISRAIKRAGIGRVVFDGIFDKALGVTDENPDGDSAMAQSLHGLSMEEVEQKMNSAATEFLQSDTIESRVPAFLRWLAERVSAVTVWTTVKIIVLACKTQGLSSTIDLWEIREKLAGEIDKSVAHAVRDSALKLWWILIGVVSICAILIAVAVGFFA